MQGANDNINRCANIGGKRLIEFTRIGLLIQIGLILYACPQYLKAFSIDVLLIPDDEIMNTTKRDSKG